jgi:hypothetical protein
MPYATIVHGAICLNAIDEALPEIQRRAGRLISADQVLRTIGPAAMLEERAKTSTGVKGLDYETIGHNLVREVPRLYFEAIERALKTLRDSGHDFSFEGL